MTVLCVCGSDPVRDHTTGSFAVAGYVKTGGGIGKKDVSVHFFGGGYDGTVKTDQLGRYEFTVVPSGRYTIEVELSGHVAVPETKEIAVDGEMTVDDIVVVDASHLAENGYLFGRILSSDGNPVTGAEVRYETRGAANGTITSFSGYYELTVPLGDEITVTPRKNGYDFDFSPRNFTFTPGKTVTRCDFIAQNNGGQLFSIQGRAVDKNGVRVDDVIVLEGRDEFQLENPDSNGNFAFYNLRPGSYTLLCGGLYTFNPKYITVAIDSGDVDLRVLTAAYIHTTKYALMGRIVDEGGRGVGNIPITFTGGYVIGDSETDGDGYYYEEVQVGGPPMPDSISLMIRPEKEGFVFKPDSLIIGLSRIDDVRYADPVTLPDIVATYYAVFTVSEYFPLSPSASWTYKRTVNGGAPVEHVMAVIGSVLHDGMMYRTFSPSGPAGIGEYRVDGNGVYGISDGSRAEVFRFGVVPGTFWNVPRTTGLGAYRAVFSGSEDVNVPAGSFDDCAKYELMTLGANTYELWTIWFARGAGMVRQEYTLVNYGEVREHTLDELRRYVK